MVANFHLTYHFGNTDLHTWYVAYLHITGNTVACLLAVGGGDDSYVVGADIKTTPCSCTLLTVRIDSQ